LLQNFANDAWLVPSRLIMLTFSECCFPG